MRFLALTLLLLVSTSACAQPLSDSSMRQGGCDALVRKICHSEKTGHCEAVYIAADNASDECKNMSPENIENVCGSASAKLFNSDMECVNPQAADDCPATIEDIKAGDVENIAKCPELQKPLCAAVCGARYDVMDVREFFQTPGRKPGLLCQDVSVDDLKNGVKFSEDPSRESCLETHHGMFTWCTNYNKSYNGVDLGAFVQCQGRINK